MNGQLFSGYAAFTTADEYAAAAVADAPATSLWLATAIPVISLISTLGGHC